MAIKGIKQPELIQIENHLRLRKYDGSHEFALTWYLDPELVYLVDGVRKPYTLQKLKQMYEYLDSHGELYFIEILEESGYRPVGDVTFWSEDMPIVIGDPAYRGKGIGKKVVAALTERGRELGYHCLYISEIYSYNIASRKCFESIGFEAYEKTERGNRFRMFYKTGRYGEGAGVLTIRIAVTGTGTQNSNILSYKELSGEDIIYGRKTYHRQLYQHLQLCRNQTDYGGFTLSSH